MSLPSAITPTQAQEIVERIAKDYGWISQSAREQSHPEALDAIEHLQIGLGAAARTLAHNLYQSNARFLFELTQNAEDNSYSRAKAMGAEPCIKFTIRPDTIVIDCNEDGFTPEHVRAICRIGESTKVRAGTQYYIGEKGIGFKSVFMVASKVHIQSGPFSFFFQHEPGNNGMGMVTPIWEPPATSLKLRKIVIDEDVDVSDTEDDSKEQEEDDERENEGQQENKDGQETEDEDDQETDLGIRGQSISTYSCEIDQNTSRARITQSIESGAETVTDSDEYRIVRRTLSDLPFDPQRNYNTAEVILAFPVIEFDQGLDCVEIWPRNVYAFFPIRDFGFPFIIHSDFVTQASREDIMNNVRNRAIFEGIAGAFVDAVLQFCHQTTLQHQWVDYIPDDKEVRSPFWSELLTRIKETIKKTPVLWPRSRSRLRLISELKAVPRSFRDCHGNPLVPDLTESEIYLSSMYKLRKLKELGLKTMHIRDCVARIGRDAMSAFSKMRLADDDWHERVALVLLVVFTKPYLKEKIPYLKTLPLIPLGNGSWTSMSAGPVFFPGSDEVPIPSDLGLRLIEPNSIKNATRKTLFTKLGAVDADENTVRMLIMEKHRKAWSEITLEASISHLHYLYWTRPPLGSLRFRRSSPICLFNDLNIAVDGNHDLYFLTNGEYGVRDLLALVRDEYSPEMAQSFGSFINPRYLSSAPRQTNDASSISFSDWLVLELLVLRYPRLHDPNVTSQLSKLFHFITEKVPDKILGTLKTYWTSYSSLIAANPVLKQSISDLVVPSTNVGPRELRRTFLPLSGLEERVRNFLDPGSFPFLTLSHTSNIEEWEFLKTLGVGVAFNIGFCLEVLRRLKAIDASASYGIYEDIQRLIWVSADQSADTERVRRVIYDEDLILVPAQYTWAPKRWTWSNRCLWDGPNYMRTKYSLLPALSGINSPTLTAFFVGTLDVKNVSYDDFIQELLFTKENPRRGADSRVIYTHLQAMASLLNAAELETVRTSFEVNALVYDTIGKAWVFTSSCLWSKDAQIPGKITISSQYADLKNFFVGMLKVKVPDLGLLVDELSQSESAELTVKDVKSLFWQINGFSPTSKTLKKLESVPIFPVREANGTLGPAVLRLQNERFSIIDRQSWADALYGKIDVLDFNLEEVRRLQPFLSSFDLSKRYLSRAVAEESSFQGEDREQSWKRTRQLRNRAYAMARCAAHFNSPRIRKDSMFIYRLLLQAEVYEVDGIIGNLVHADDEKTVIVEVDKSKLHITEKSGVLKVYIPRNWKDQELCFLQVLPTKMFNETIMGNQASNSALASDSEAVRIIAALFVSSDEVVNDLLDHAGIIPVCYADEFDIEAFDRDFSVNPTTQYQKQTDLEEVTESVASLRILGGQSAEGTVASPKLPHVSPPSSSSYRTHLEATTIRYHQSSSIPVSSRPFTIQSKTSLLYLSDGSKSEYCRLLSNIIAAAKSKRGGFPSLGAFNLHDLYDFLPIGAETAPISFDMPFGARIENQLAHDMRVGAAGELYVFEILKRLTPVLPGFDRDNWKSTIRRFVTVHPDYSDMDPWTGPETADITYDDTRGDLTKLLVENKYLDDHWIGAKPMYFLEVKTTTKECDTRFFVSKSQYRKIEKMRLRNGERSSEVYIIFRVFNLDKDTIDMRLYVDPKGIDEGGDLIFIPESYSVLPSGSTST